MKAKKNNISMTKCLSFCVFILLVFINCKGIPKQPVEGANQYCEDLANCAVKNDYDQADELTRNYLDNYKKDALIVFIMELKRQLCTSEKHHLGVFISNADSVKYQNIMELMRRIVAVSKAEEQNVQYSGSGTEKAALFCSILTDLAKVQDYNKAKSLMKEFVNDYVDKFYPDGAVYLNDHRYKECKDFCVSFKKNMTQDIWNFLNSEGMQSEEYRQFQMMALSGLQAAEDE
ncbi:hypothetical protein [uncultured Prevotella sp.]|uniref:hypothetical protein n=1 Tax=uncultured Prevotella sp. TaxID=159272 RepID=UPI00266FE919|nr:hypothetical protein [uncultured Prevotella sp.]